MARLNLERKSGFILRDGRQRRQMRWLRADAAVTNIPTAGTAILLTALSVEGIDQIPFTVVRTRGLLTLASDQIANGENQWIAYGHIVVKVTAQAIGVTAVPTPLSEGEDDWFVYEEFAQQIGVSSATSVFKIGGFKEFDSKAMRKVDIGDTIVTAVESAASGVSEGLQMRDAFRMLIKLH